MTKTAISPELREAIVKGLGAALAEAWCRRRRVSEEPRNGARPSLRETAAGLECAVEARSHEIYHNHNTE